MNKFILYLASYVPLYLILIIKNILLKFENRGWKFDNIKYFNSVDDFVITILLILTIVSIGYITIQVKGINKHHKNSYKILKVNNFSSDSILNYISIYILTFIEFDLNSISNIVTLIFIIGLLGIISIRYDDLYINPTLLLWNYKVYNITIEKNGNPLEKIVLVNGNIYDNTQIEIYDTTREYAFGDIIKSK